jgi:hypothetical protein
VIDAGGYFYVGDGIDGHVVADPGFVSWSADGDCSNDDLRLASGSALRDAGDPKILDPDGSRSDIGAYGGPEAPDDWYIEEEVDTSAGSDTSSPDNTGSGSDTDSIDTGEGNSDAGVSGEESAGTDHQGDDSEDLSSCNCSAGTNPRGSLIWLLSGLGVWIRLRRNIPQSNPD